MEEMFLSFRDIYFGQIEAKSEKIKTDEERKSFRESFLLPYNINIEDFVEGRMRYIYGLKGTGKTALLRYLSILINDDYSSPTSFILFKTDIKENTRQDFEKTASVFNTEMFNGLGPESQDFEIIWRWVFHRHIVETIERNKLPIFKDDKNWNDYKKHVMAIKLISDETGLPSLIPSLTEGYVDIEEDSELPLLKYKLISEQTVARTKFISAVAICDALFKLLKKMSEMRLYVLIDELELSKINLETYNRDIRLIRDLIVVMDEMNVICAEYDLNIYFIASVRSEVLNSIESAGKEINKSIEDFGQLISWDSYLNHDVKHPLIQIILKRIKTAYKRKNIPLKKTDKVIFDLYFPNKIQGMTPEKYILIHTWFRPRDIVRLLILSQKEHLNQNVLNQLVFDNIRKQYSLRSWSEVCEELITRYSPDELFAVETLLTGFSAFFYFAKLKTRVDLLIKEDNKLKCLIDRISLVEILNDLYTIGVLGNNYKESTHEGIKIRTKVRFAFRGDKRLLTDKRMMIHNALKGHLSN
jgi:Cdc6-like AAA superfamily ATPase